MWPPDIPANPSHSVIVTLMWELEPNNGLGYIFAFSGTWIRSSYYLPFYFRDFFYLKILKT